MGGSPSTPKPSKAEQRAQRESLRIQQEQIDLARAEAAKPIPQAPKILPAPPAPTVTSADAAAAAERERMKAAKRTNAGRGTLFAGETGGYMPKTLLG